MGVYRERNTHLSKRKIQVFHRKDTRIGIEHLNRTFVRKVYLGFISYQRMHIPRNAETRVTHFETTFLRFCLEFVFSPDCSMNFG